MTEYGNGSSFTVRMDGPFGSVGGTSNKLTTVTVTAGNWKGAVSPYSQVVDMGDISVNSKIDLQMSADQLEKFRDQEIAFTAENEDGVVTIFAVGDKPTVDCEFQVIISEVVSV